MNDMDGDRGEDRSRRDLAGGARRSAWLLPAGLILGIAAGWAFAAGRVVEKLLVPLLAEPGSGPLAEMARQFLPFILPNLGSADNSMLAGGLLGLALAALILTKVDGKTK